MIEDVFLAKSFWLKNKPVSAKALGISAAATKFLLRSIWNTRYEQRRRTCVLCSFKFFIFCYFYTSRQNKKTPAQSQHKDTETMLLAMFPCAFIVNFEQIFDRKKKQTFNTVYLFYISIARSVCNIDLYHTITLSLTRKWVCTSLWHLLVRSQQCKHQNNIGNQFKGSSKDTTTMPMTSFWCLFC